MGEPGRSPGRRLPRECFLEDAPAVSSYALEGEIPEKIRKLPAPPGRTAYLSHVAVVETGRWTLDGAGPGEGER